MGMNNVSRDCEYLARAIRIVSQKWSIEVLIALYADSPLRFGELKNLCVSQFRGTISSRTLADRLRLLQLREFVERTAYNEVPPRVEYRLTEDGERLAQALCAVLRTTMEKIDRTHPDLAAERSYSRKNPMVDEVWLRSLETSRKFIGKKLEKDPKLAMHMENTIRHILG